MKRCIPILIAALIPGGVCAQETAAGWPAQTSSGLSTVYVRDDSGVETSGKLLHLNPDSIVILVDGAERRFDAARVTRIQRRGDSLRNGAIIGAIVGVGLGFVTAGIADCPGDRPGGGCPGSRAALFMVSTGVYAAIGTGIDALIPGRTTLYEASKTPSAADRGEPAPIAFRSRAAVNVRVRW
jgi:hypothetical protein